MRLCVYIQLVRMYVGVQESVRWGGDEYVAFMYVFIVQKGDMGAVAVSDHAVLHAAGVR